MEQHLPIIAKKFWSIVRVLYLMLRKGISKGKLFADLNTMIQRGKLAGKAAIHNLMFHHHLAAASYSGRRFHDGSGSDRLEYEFSCKDSPALFHFPSFHVSKRRHSHAPPPLDGDLLAAAALEMINSAAASPALPGFGPSPMVRQLRITDSPFPLRDERIDGDDRYRVDEAAEEFIIKFYKDLKRQNARNLE